MPKSLYYTNKFNEANGNSKMFWKIIGDFTAKNSSHNKIQKMVSEEEIELNINSHHKDIANDFNVYFSNISNNLYKFI